MQDTSEIINYDSLMLEDYEVETKVNIDGVDYGRDVLISVSTSLSLFSGNAPKIGCCPSGEIEIKMLMPNVEFSRMAEIIPYVRLKGTDGTVSGWLQMGVYYIDTRKEIIPETGEGTMELHGYDAMLKTNAYYPNDQATYPKSDIYVVGKIAETIGVNVDARTAAIMTEAYSINLPMSYTMREVLGYIASMYAGNFIISPVGELRLVELAGIGNETRFLIDESGDAIVFGEDRILT